MRYEDRLVKDVLKVRNKFTDHIGIEIETEGSRLPHVDTEVWKSEADNSLRGESFEYVLRTPVPFSETGEVLQQLGAEWKENKSKIKDSPNAGVHVHINCGDLTVKQLYNYISLFLVVENILVESCGVDRVGNLFCLRCCDAEFLIDALSLSIREQDLRILHTDELRYAALNVKALGDYGSLEFRSWRSDGDLDGVKWWCDLLQHLKALARVVDSPAQIVADVSEKHAKGFFDAILGDFTKDIPWRDEYEDAINDSVRRVQQYAYQGNW
jgi:hypothetical protein